MHAALSRAFQAIGDAGEMNAAIVCTKFKADFR